MRSARVVTVVIALVIVIAGLLAGCGGRRDRAPDRATLSVTELLADDDVAGYARALTPRPFHFPRDHGAHRPFRNEWWYFTGNVRDPRGQRFGFQLTFFRSRLASDAPPRASRWATDEAFMAHFALTDVERGEHHAFERFGGARLGLAGAADDHLRVWLDDWFARSAQQDQAFPLHLHAEDDGVALDLRLEPGKPVVAQGDRGLSRKSAAPGNASHYYSMTRLPARGTITADGRTLTVEGTAWLDREWSTSALGEGQVGWDWFALQLDDETELMFYRLRRADGSSDVHSAGSFVAPDASVVRLTHTDVELQTLDYTEIDGTRYPTAFRLRAPRADLDVEVRAPVADQELRVSVRYWEGAVDVTGTRGGRAVRGVGYVELTGYRR